MANEIGVLARLQFDTSQFTSSSGRAAAEVANQFKTVGEGVDKPFLSAFARVSTAAREALQMPRSSTGSLDLSSQIEQLTRARDAAFEEGVALRELQSAALAAAAAGRGNAESLRAEADGYMAAARAAEVKAASLRGQIGNMEAIQGELVQTASVTRSSANADDEVAHASGRASIAKMELMHVVRSSSDAFAAGAPVMQIFSMEMGRVAEAAALAGGGTGALGTIGSFLGGPWGLVVTGAVAVLTPFVAKLFEQNDALGEAIEKLRSDAAAHEIDRQAHEAFRHTAEGLTAAIREQDEALQHASLSARQNAVVAEHRAEQQLVEITTTRAATQATLNYAEALQVANRAQATRGGVQGEAASLGLSAQDDRISALRASLALNDASIRGATDAVSRSHAAIAAIDAQELSTPIGRINREYAEMARRASEAAIATGHVTTALTDQLLQIERNHQAALRTEQDRQSAARRDANATARAGPLTDFEMPVSGYHVTSPFGVTRPGHTHAGVDLAVPVGTEVRAPAGGAISFSGNDGPNAGNTIKLELGAGTQAVFMHLSEMLVHPGETVTAGQVIGRSGGARGAEGSGDSTGPHLHYEVREHGRAVNPLTGRFPTDESQAGDAGQRAAAAAARTQAEATRAAQELLTYNQLNADTVAGINSRWDEQPKLIDQARADAQHLDEIIAAYRDHTGEATHATAEQSTAMIAAAQAARQTIVQGLDRPFQAFVRSQREGLAVQQLTLQGRDAEASALQTALRLQEQMGPLTREQLATIEQSAEAQQRIADAIEDQRRVVSLYTGAVGDAQKVFDNFLSTLQNGNAGSAISGLVSGWTNTFATLQRNLLSNAIFGGVDRDIERYVRQMTGQQTPAEILQQQSRDAGAALSDGIDRNVNALDRLTAAFTTAGGRLRDGSLDPISASGGDWSSISDSMASSTFGGFGPDIAVSSRAQYAPANDNGSEIVVTGARELSAAAHDQLTASGVLGVMIDRFSTNLEHLGVHIPLQISKELARDLPTVLQGASIGQLGGSVFASITGGKNNSTASAIGGALGEVAGKAIGNTVGKAAGSLLGSLGSAAGPIGAVVGGILGNIVGGLFTKPTWSNATLSTTSTGQVSADTNAAGRGSAAVAAASAEAKSVASAVDSILDQLGATVQSLAPITLGTFDGKYRVDTQGRTGSMDSKHMPGVKDFGDDQQSAIAYAVAYELSHAVITGISKASQKILSEDGDVNAQLAKVMMIEQIPKDLKAMLDPVGAAIDTFNAKWKKTLDALNEGGASADQLAQAQQLYDLQLAQVKNSTASASQALKDFLTSLNVGPNSPLSLRDQEAAAKTSLQPFLDEINSGQSVDQSKYQDAAKAFLDIERQLYGSTQDYFDAFNLIQAETNKAIAAIDNAVPITAGVPDPFTKATADSTAATATNTGTTNELLSQVTDQLGNIAGILSSIGYSGQDLSAFLGTSRVFKTG